MKKIKIVVFKREFLFPTDHIFYYAYQTDQTKHDKGPYIKEPVSLADFESLAKEVLGWINYHIRQNNCVAISFLPDEDITISSGRWPLAWRCIPFSADEQNMFWEKIRADFLPQKTSSP